MRHMSEGKEEDGLTELLNIDPIMLQQAETVRMLIDYMVSVHACHKA